MRQKQRWEVTAMPDVIIKDMEMPECCGRCPCFHAETPMYCQAVKADRSKRIKTPYAVRPNWCPLRPAPDGMERLTPKKPTRNTRYGMGGTYYDYFCPGCSRLLSYEPDAYRRTVEKFCYRCGQTIDWTEVESHDSL